MNQFSRRKAIGFGIASVAGFPVQSAAGPVTAPDKPDDETEHAMTFKLKGVIIDQIDEAGRSITARFGNQKKPSKLVDIPVYDVPIL